MASRCQQPPDSLGFLPQCLGAEAHRGDPQQALKFLAVHVLEEAVFQGLPGGPRQRALLHRFPPGVALMKLVEWAFAFTEVKMAMLSASMTVTCPKRA